METQANNGSANDKLIVLRPYNKKELCYLFGDMSRYYLDRILDDVPDLGERLGNSFSPDQVIKIVQHYGFTPIFMERQKIISK